MKDTIQSTVDSIKQQQKADVYIRLGMVAYRDLEVNDNNIKVLKFTDEIKAF